MDRYNRLLLEHPFLIRSFVSAYRYEDWTPPPEREKGSDGNSFSQLVYLTKGEALYTIGGVSYPVRAGEMVYRPAGVPYQHIFKTEKVSLALVSFHIDAPSMAAFAPSPFPLYGEEISTFLDLVDAAARIIRPVKEGNMRELRIVPGTPPEVVGFVGASLERFLSMVYCRLKEIPLLPDRSRKTGEYREEETLASRIKSHLIEHIGESFSLEALSHHFGVAQTSLCRAFKRHYNCSILDWVTDMKILLAKEQLELSQKSYAEIAESLGYSSVNYFSRTFKKKTGMTPTEYSKLTPLSVPPRPN